MSTTPADNSTTVERTQRKLLEEWSRQDQTIAEQATKAGGEDALLGQKAGALMRGRGRRAGEEAIRGDRVAPSAEITRVHDQLKGEISSEAAKVSSAVAKLNVAGEITGSLAGRIKTS